MKTRRELAEEIGINYHAMNAILKKMCVQVSVGTCQFFLAPYENYEKELRTVGEDGRLHRETFLTEEGEELIREVLKNDKSIRNGDDHVFFARNKWGRRVYVRDNKPYSSDPAFYDRNPGGICYKA